MEAVAQVARARSGGRQAHSHLPGPLRVAAGHKCGHFLVARLDEVDLLLMAVEGPERGVYPITRVSINPLHAPLPQTLEHEVRDAHRHWAGPPVPPPLF